MITRERGEVAIVAVDELTRFFPPGRPGGANDYALREAMKLISKIQIGAPSHLYGKVGEVISWVEVFFSERKHHHHGADQVASWIRSDLYTIKSGIEEWIKEDEEQPH